MGEVKHYERIMTDTSALKFPCDFPIKIMGLATKEFENTVREICQKHFPELTDANISYRNSTDGKYLSITVTIHATSKAQLDAIYMELTASEYVIMAL